DESRGRHAAAGTDCGGLLQIEPETAAFQCLPDVSTHRCRISFGEGKPCVRHEQFGESDASEGQAQRLLNAATVERQALETAAAKVEDVEVSQLGKRRIDGEAAADEVGFLGPAQDANLVTRGRANARAK